MTKVLRRNRAIDYLKLFAWELFQLTVCGLRSDSRKLFLPTLQASFARKAASALMMIQWFSESLRGIGHGY